MADDLILQSLRGGLNDEDPPNAIDDDQCTIANNVEFYFSTLGERRRGSATVSLVGSGLENAAVIVHVNRHFPTVNESDSQLWVFGGSEGGTLLAAYLSPSGTWMSATLPDTPVTTSPSLYRVQTQSLNGKFFIAYNSLVDRLHVWDGTSVRRTGLAQPNPPTAVDDGAGGTFSGIRYYRVRYIKQSGSTIQVRSEPSTTLTFTPSGVNDGAVVTRPALIGESETHWELEASTDNATFYVLTTLPIATTTFLDTTVFATGYSAGVQSETIGTYALQGSAVYLAADEDRLVLGGDWQQTIQNSRVAWTPVLKDPGVGNDERLPTTVDNFYDLNSFEGGGVTALAHAVSGSFYAFKQSQSYKLVRTGSPLKAYGVITLTKSIGALIGSVFVGLDEMFSPCVYGYDPSFGPWRISKSGPQRIKGLLATLKRINTFAHKVFAAGVYYPDKYQAIWYLPADGADSPTLGLKLQVTETQEIRGAIRRGWSTFDGVGAQAYTACIMNEVVLEADGITKRVEHRPYLGTILANGSLLRSDVGGADNGTAYIAHIRTKPFFLTSLLDRWGAMVGALLATANNLATILVSFVIDFDVNATVGSNNANTLESEKTVQVTLDPKGSEAFVIKQMDNLSISNATAIQIDFQDPPVEGQGTNL